MTLFANRVEIPLEAVTDIEHVEFGVLLTLDPAKAPDIARQFGRYTANLKLSILIWGGLNNDKPCTMSLIVEGIRHLIGDGVYDLKPTESELHTVSLMLQN